MAFLRVCLSKAIGLFLMNYFLMMARRGIQDNLIPMSIWHMGSGMRVLRMRVTRMAQKVAAGDPRLRLCGEILINLLRKELWTA
jgi:hypothetical protein